MAKPPSDEDKKERGAGSSGGGSKARARGGRRWMGWLGLFNVVVYAVMLLVCALVLMPESTKDLEDDGSAVGNLLKTLQTAVDENAESLELSQNEINRYIEDTLSMESGDNFAGALTRWESVLVRLNDGSADVVMKRKVAGLTSTISIRIEVELEKKRVVLSIPSGRFGSIPVPSGLSRMVMPAYESLRKAYEKEVNLMLGAKKITFEEGKVLLLLHPKE